MTNMPLTSGEQAKIFIFVLLIIPTLLIFVGILPAVFLLFGVFLLKKNQDFSAIETSVKLVFGCLWIGLLIALGSAVYWGGTYWGGTYGTESATSSYGQFIYANEVTVSLATFAIIIAYMLIIHFLYFLPLRNHRDWVARNGIFSSTAIEEKKHQKANDIRIIKGENMRSYSVADELSKWAKLRDEGVVSEQEFQEARNKILQSQ